MKRFLWRFFRFIVFMVIGALGLSILAPQRLAPTKTAGVPEKIVPSADFALLSLATDAIDRFNIDPKRPWHKYVTQSSLFYDLEKVEVIARSVTFPSVLYQGELMISIEYPNAAILCLDTAYYAGRVQGLMWAMDRGAIEEHKLYWTIDDASELFDACVDIFQQEAVDDPNANDKDRLDDVKEALSARIQQIQEKLRFAKHVKIKAGRSFVPIRLHEGVRNNLDGP